MKNNFLKRLMFLSFFLLSIYGYSQTVTGVVKDALGEVVGANIIVKGTNNGVNTGIDGSYQIKNIKPNDVLVFSFVGYKTKEILVGTKSTINVFLEEDSNNLDEVVVVGYGTKSRKLVTGAISSVKSEDITKTPVISADQALQGQAAGVSVVNAGSPGASPQVLIRGVNTFGNSQPLYVIDGVVSGGLNEINPNDIETIDVLKDASTAAIYGSRASNGVVMITTKKGKRGKTRVSFDSYVAIQSVPRTLNLLNSSQFREYAEGTFGLPNRYTDEPNTVQRNTDWQDEVFRSALLQNTNVNVSGGTETAVFSLSAGYLDQEGIVINTGFNRSSLRLNSEFKIGERFKIGETLSIADSKRLNEEQNGDRTLVEHLIKSLPYTPVYDANNLGGFGGPDTRLDNGSDAENAVRLQTLGSNLTESLKALGAIYASYEIFDGLTYKFLYGFERTTVQNNIHRPTFNEGVNKRDAAEIQNGTNTFSTKTYTNSLTYSKIFNDLHKLDVLLVAERFESTSRFNLSRSNNPLTNEIPVVQGQADVTNVLNEYGLTSYVARLNYAFNKKYLFSAAIRRDASSRFGANNKWGTFPSVSAGWILSEEDFLQDSSISNLKLRGSWGVTGNDFAGDYVYNAGLATGYNYVGFNNNIGVSSLSVPNPNLKWEESSQLNFGLDFGFLDNSITGSLEYFKNKATDVIVVIPEPASSGAGNPNTFRNGADIDTKGYEISLGYNHDKGKDFKWSANLNLGTFKSEVTALNNVDFIAYNTFEGENITRVSLGEAPFYFYGLQTDGLFQVGDDTSAQPNAAPGDIRFVDQDGNGIIDADDNVKIGNQFPDFTFGLNLTANYKQFDASLFFSGSVGNDIYNTNIYDLEGMTRLFNAGTAVLDRWTPTNTNTNIPRFTLDHSDNVNGSDRFIEDGSYAKLRNLTIGYSFKNNVLENIGKGLFSKARFYVTGQNLFTITNYSGYDPEVGGSTVTPNQKTPTAGVGIDRGVYPQPMSFVVGLQLAF